MWVVAIEDRWGVHRFNVLAENADEAVDNAVFALQGMHCPYHLPFEQYYILRITDMRPINTLEL